MIRKERDETHGGVLSISDDPVLRGRSSMTNEDVVQVTLPSCPIQAAIPEVNLLRYPKFSFDNSDATSNAPVIKKMQFPGALEATACVSRILTLKFLRVEVREHQGLPTQNTRISHRHGDAN